MSSTPGDRLEPYRSKRNPAATPEPFGDARPGAAGSAPRFVVQKHWARNLHYDLRLELDGTLKSWAVPKGPSTRVEEKRLAVHVEDHPLEYADFEGVIPRDNYGAGSVIVWDRGRYGSFKPEGLMEQYARGKMELELFGFKLRGRWTLVRMGRKQDEWLLLKKDDGAASEREAIDRYPESVITGLTVEEMRDVPATLAAIRERIESLGAPLIGAGASRRGTRSRAAGPPVRGTGSKAAAGPPELMLATLAERPPAGEDWCFEIKYDGVRAIARRAGDEVRLIGRSGEDITGRYPEVAGALAALPHESFVLDGEIIAEDGNGRPDFQLLQARMRLSKPRDVAGAVLKVPVRGVFFDCLELMGHDLRSLALVHRKELLARVVPPLGVAQRCDHVTGHGEAFFEAASEMGLEGIVAKRLDRPYLARRSPDWVKVKCQRRGAFVIGGWTDPKGSRGGFGALHVGLYEGERLAYVTKVGTGFDDRTIDRIAALLATLERDASPFDQRSPGGKGNHWVEPRLVCEVRYTEWTREGGLRHPTFMGLVPDANPQDCRRDEAPVIDLAESAEAVMDPPAPARAPRARVSRAAVGAAPVPAPGAPSRPAAEMVKITNPRKVFWPDGTTKGDLVAYYESVAPLLLPYLRDRPVVLTRFPDGMSGKSFFQKDAPVFTPDWVRTETIYSSDTKRDIRYFVIDDAASLRYIANLGTIPIHVWSSRAPSLGHPDWLVIDLDPKSAPFTQVVSVARTVRGILEDLELPAYVKTSGATGLHVLIPMGRQYTGEEVRTFARLLAMLVVEEVPDLATVTRAIRGREGKVYVDFGQNGYGNTIVGPYSVRPLPGAPASCPLRWDEVTPRLDPAAFTIRTIPPRFERMEDPMCGVLGEGIDMVAAIERIQRRMAGGEA